MKVCHVTNFLPECEYDWGGAEQVCSRVVRILNARGHENFVIAKKTVGSSASSVYRLATMEDFLWKGMHAKTGAYKVLGPSVDPVSFLRFRRYLKELKPDIVHFHNFLQWLSFSLVMAARELRIPSVLTVYDYWYFCPAGNLVDSSGAICRRHQGSRCSQCYNPGKHALIKKAAFLLRKKTFDAFLGSVDAFIALSRSSADILGWYGIDGKKIHVVPQPVLDAAEPTPLPVEPFSLLYVGKISRVKGLHVAVRALGEVKGHFPRAKLYVVGSFFNAEYENFVRGLIRENSLGESVVFLGKVGPEELSGLIKTANAVVIPEQWENMCPVILVEAMAAKKPVIASSIGGIPEFVEDGVTGFLARHDDPLDFARAVTRIFTDAAGARSVAERARERAMEVFDSEITAKGIIGVYERVLRPQSLN
jgi:glycosyltransferase involved in cell wall biosynthesis